MPTLRARLRRLPVLPFAAAALLAAGAALAAEPGAGPGPGAPAGAAGLDGPTEPAALAADVALFETGELDETAYDIPGKIIVDARDDLDSGAIAALARDYSLSFTPTMLEGETREEIAEAPPSRIRELIARLSGDSRVELVEPLARVHAFFTPDDPLLKEQWHMERIGAPRAWDFATGRGVTVAVVDTGIACETYGPFMKGTDLKNTECVPGWNFVTKNEHANDDQGHGTHVAGTIAQSTNNALGAAGIAFHARLMPVKVLSAEGWGSTADVADGIRWAAEHGAQVINLSLGGPRNSGVLQKAIDFALSRGAVVVAAAGNTGGRVQYPGASDGVIGVSATGPDDKLAKFSSRGDGVDLAAPGVNVVQQTICKKGRDKCEQFATYNGTSMASPHVAGAAALMVGLGVTDPASVEEALRKGARVVDTSDGAAKLYGAGVLHAADAAARVTFNHALTRILALLAITALAYRSARKKNASATRPLSLAYWLPALATGPGLLFFAPWILPRVDLAVDLLARPIADFDFLIGASVHRFLPFANALIPFALTAVAFGVKKARPVIAGVAAGTGAYLASVAVLGDAFGPLGHAPMILWCAANAVVCAFIARTNLAETT
ncbi:MAG: S8 family peptidase [Byssovorax sp.]